MPHRIGPDRRDQHRADPARRLLRVTAGAIVAVAHPAVAAGGINNPTCAPSAAHPEPVVVLHGLAYDLNVWHLAENALDPAHATPIAPRTFGSDRASAMSTAAVGPIHRWLRLASRIETLSL